jgi:S1-C subfamily serine protease
MRCAAIGFLLFGLLLMPVELCAAAAGEDVRLEASILLVKPAVVLISSEVGATVAVNCGTGPVQRVQPDPIYETGSGFIIHPDGFIVTNGHVVQRFYEMNESQLAREFLRKAAAMACGPALAMVPDGARKERLRAIVGDPANQGKIQLSKRLQAHLSTGTIYSAEVKAYSPAIKSEEGPSASGRASASGNLDPERSGKDVAILKIEEHNLPTVRLAPSSASLKLGEQIFVLGYPGVVLNHDFLSQKSQLEASVTVGRVSGFKLDLTNRRVIQTDAAITWGNSGGPAFSLQGDVIGVATFISTTPEGDQAIQGFNFLIPVDSVREFAQQIGLVPEADTSFMQAWSNGVRAYFDGEYQRSLEHTNAAIKIMPGFPDVERLRAEVQTRVDKNPRFMLRGKRIGFGLGLVAAVALLGVGAREMRRRRLVVMPNAVRRVDAEEIRRRLDIGSGVALVDARHGEAFEGSPIQAAGALRFDIDHPDIQSLRVRVSPDGEVVAYCD